MRNLIEILQGADPIDHQTAVDALQILVPIVEAVPRDDEADRAVSGLIARIDGGGVLQALADWWFTVATGYPTPTGIAYYLPPVLGDQVVRAMNSLLALRPDGISPAEQFEKLTMLERHLAQLDDRLKLDFYGISKLPGERQVWDWLVNDLADVVASSGVTMTASNGGIGDGGFIETELSATAVLNATANGNIKIRELR